jgi:hypothetical protein
VKVQEWATIKAILGLEIDHAASKYKLDKILLEEIYFRFMTKVEAHVFITDPQEAQK